MYECHNCGSYVHHDDAPPMEIDGHLVCPECVCAACNGTGQIGDDDDRCCAYCDGTGMEPLDREE